jgi:hypothetical protein
MFTNFRDDIVSGSGLNKEEVMALVTVGSVLSIGICCFIRLLCVCRNYETQEPDLDNTSTEALYGEVSDNYHVQIHPRTHTDSLESPD